jgi:uncharacterized protein
MRQIKTLLSEPSDVAPVKRVWGLWATMALGLLIFTVYAIIVVLAILITIAISHTRSIANYEGLILAISEIGIGVICVSLIAILVRLKVKKWTRVASYLGLRLGSKKQILVFLAITFVLNIFISIIASVLHVPQDSFWDRAFSTSILPPLLWIGIVVFGPIFEETLFRGFLFQGFKQTRLGTTGTVILLAFVFALLHYSREGSGYYEMAGAFIMGLAFGIARLRTGSLWTPILMHSFFNLMSLFATMISQY